MSTRQKQPKLSKAAAAKAAQRAYSPDAVLAKPRLSPPRLRLLPITMMMLVLLLGLKLNDLYLGGNKLRDMLQVPNAQAEEKPKEMAKEDGAAKPDAAAPADAMTSKDAPKEEGKDEAAMGKKDAKEVKLASLDKDASPEKEAPHQYSQIEIDILQNLTKRREELDEQANKLDLKEKLLDATELRVNDKLTEMKSLKAEVDKLLEEYNKQEDGKLTGLVKIYENMKPKDAAQIFNELDMPILLEVVDRMSERKVAPVLAGMNPTKAKELTVELADYRKLKSVPRTMGAN